MNSDLVLKLIFLKYFDNFHFWAILTLTLLTWRIWWAPNNASRWDLTLILLTWRIWWASNNASRWKMGFKPYPANVENMVSL